MRSMARRMEESDLLIHPAASSRGVQPSLLSPISELRGPRLLLKQLSCLPCNICIKSKAAMLILVWSIVIGAIYLSLLAGFASLGFALQNNVIRKLHINLNLVICMLVVECAILALVMLLYPVSGYIADVHCGRYRTVTCSFIFLWIAMLSLSCAAAMGIKVNFDHFGVLAAPNGIFVAVSLILIILGLACYQANIIQLGLDQLFEAPSEKLGLFVHWFVWAYTLGNFLTHVIFMFLPCYVDDGPIKAKLQDSLASGPFVTLVVLTFLLIFTCYNHSWFYSEPGQHNPYKTVIRVLNFARKNKYPRLRSAFTYCDDFQPSRIDFAKERYGGPFTTSQVEDVKTLLRVASVLLALGPLFVLEIPGSFGIFFLFALHTSKNYQFYAHHSCSSPAKWVLIQSGGIGYIASIIFLPIYMWVVYSLFRKRVPKILNRLQFAVLLSIAGVFCLLIIDLAGHFHHRHQHPNSTNSTCLFTSPYLVSAKQGTPVVLNMHWSVNILPCALLNIGSLLIRATSFEFISAQSPHSMKGLLVGVFFAIKGLFQFISATTLLPFAIPNLWKSINSITNCGFGYYLFTIVVSSIGLVIFSIVVRRYSYRQRDDRPFDQRFAEQYYERYMSSAHSSTTGVYSSSEESLYHEELGYTCSDGSDTMSSISRDYGTTTRMQNSRKFLQRQLSDKLPDDISSKK